LTNSPTIEASVVNTDMPFQCRFTIPRVKTTRSTGKPRHRAAGQFKTVLKGHCFSRAENSQK
jgi:hypothetical protein